MSGKKSVSKCTQVDTELVSVSLGGGYEGGRGPSPRGSRAPFPVLHPRPHPPHHQSRHQRRLRRTFSDGQSRNTSEEYLLNGCTLDSSFGNGELEEPPYRYDGPKYSDEQLISRAYGNPYPHQPELVCNCVHPNYYCSSNTLPREKRHDPFYFSDQNISTRAATNRSSEELLNSQRSLDRKPRPKSQLSNDRKGQSARTWDRRANSKLELNFLPVSKERSLDGEDYQFRNINREACSPSRCAHSIYSGGFHHPRVHAPQCRKFAGFSGSFDRDTFESQQMFNAKCEGSCDDYFMDEYEVGKACARSLPPHFGDDGRRSESRGDGEMRPRKSWERLGGRRVIVPDGCEQDDTFEMVYNVSGCQCERCDHAGFPGGYCHHQESLRPASRQGALLPPGPPPRALAARPPSLTSSSTGTSSKMDLAQKHWYAIATVLLVAGAAGVAVPLALRVSAGASLEERLELASALLQDSPLVDGHNDLPWNIRKFLHNKLKDFRFSEDLRNIPPWSTSPWSHTDLPRLKKGLVSAQFWAAYVPCAAQHRDAVQLVLEQIDVIRRLTERYHPELVLCTSPKDIKRAHAAGRVCSLVGVEGGHALGGSLGVLRALHVMGVRYLTLTSTCDTPWAQCALADAMGNADPDHEGLAPFGRLIIKEMNRLGMMVDLSHVSQSTMRAALNATAAPILFSHSSARALCNSSRNVPDEVLRQVASNKGLVMVNFYSQFLACKNTAGVADAIAHINHIRDVAGIESVGLGAGYDGINFTPKGLEDVSTYPLLFAELLAAGWSTDELKKLAGLNFLRVFEEVERVRDEQAGAGVPPYEESNMQPWPGLGYNCTSQDLF